MLGAPPPCGWGIVDTLDTCSAPTCYAAKFGHRNSNIIKEICLKFDSRVLPFKVTQVIRTDTDHSAIYDFLLTFHSNHGTISYRFQEKRQFQCKIAILPTPIYFVLRPWIWVSVLWVTKSEWWGYQAEIEVWQYFQPSAYNTWAWPGYQGGDIFSTLNISENVQHRAIVTTEHQ